MAKKPTELDKLNAQRTLDPKGFYERVHGVLKEHGGVVTKAAASLKILDRQLWRYIAADPKLLRGTGHTPNPGLKSKDSKADEEPVS